MPFSIHFLKKSSSFIFNYPRTKFLNVKRVPSLFGLKERERVSSQVKFLMLLKLKKLFIILVEYYLILHSHRFPARIQNYRLLQYAPGSPRISLTLDPSVKSRHQPSLCLSWKVLLWGICILLAYRYGSGSFYSILK